MKLAKFVATLVLQGSLLLPLAAQAVQPSTAPGANSYINPMASPNADQGMMERRLHRPTKPAPALGGQAADSLDPMDGLDPLDLAQQ